MTTDTTVKPGQVWADNDKRAAGRTVRVERIEDGSAVCTILTNRDATPSPSGIFHPSALDVFLSRLLPLTEGVGRTASLYVGTVAPAYGQSGGGVEVYFPAGVRNTTARVPPRRLPDE